MRNARWPAVTFVIRKLQDCHKPSGAHLITVPRLMQSFIVSRRNLTGMIANYRNLFLILAVLYCGVKVACDAGVTWSAFALKARQPGENREMESWRRRSQLEVKPISNLTSFIKAAIQSARRLLKKLRRWCNSHPSELKLGRCLASYFNIKIPGPARKYDEYPGDNVLIDRSWDHVQKSTPHFHKGQVCVVEEAENTKDSFFQFFQDKFSKKGLFACASEYMKKKFWGWIDSAPEH